MQGNSTKIYFMRLLKDGHRWQYTDIAGNGNKPKFYFTSIQWLLILVSAIGTPFLLKGFNKDFISYIMTALSIFIGLFLTLILTAFDKFHDRNDIQRPTHEDQRYLKTRKNFFKQFTSLTAYAIVLSLFCIVLLGVISLTDPTFSDSILNYPLASPSKDNIMRCFRVFSKTVFNIIIMYFLLNFLLLVLYAVTSMHAYMKIEFDK